MDDSGEGHMGGEFLVEQDPWPDDMPPKFDRPVRNRRMRLRKLAQLESGIDQAMSMRVACSSPCQRAVRSQMVSRSAMASSEIMTCFTQLAGQLGAVLRER